MAAAERRGVTLSDEIRARLQSSLALNLDWRTQKFVDAVGFIAAHVRSWHRDRRSYGLLRAAISELLSHLAPPDEPSEPTPTIEREGARIAGIAIGATELGLGEEWGWDHEPGEDRRR